MAKENVPAPAPTRSDEQIFPFNAWLPIGKGNLLLDLQRLQKNPIFRISDANTGEYSFQLDEQWFILNADLLRKALDINPVDSAHPFVSLPAGDQPWRAILSFINRCLTDKTSGNDKPCHPVFQMLWDIVIRSNVNYAELLWEEFVQAIQIFFAHRANLNIPAKKPMPHVIPYCRFTKLIIFYLESEHNIHRRPGSSVHVTDDDFLLGNLKFVPKGEKDEVFGKSIPKELITEAIQNSSYYQQYLEMVARKPTAKEGGQKKTSSKADKPTPVKKPAPAKQTKPVKEKSTKPAPSTKASKGKVLKVQKGKRSDRLVDEEDEEPQPASEPQIEDDEYNLQSGVTRSLLVVEGKGKAIACCTITPIRDTPSPADAKTGADTEKSNSEADTEILNVDEERGENVSNTVGLEERTVELDKGQAGSDPGKTPESRPPPDEDQAGSNPGQGHVALAGPNPEPMHEDFVAIVYPQKEPSKANVEVKVESMVTVPIHQASSSAPPLSTPIIDLTHPKPVSPPTQELVFTTTTTTLLLPPPPPQQQSTTDPALAARVSALEEICANLAKKNKLQDQTTQALSSRIFTLENHDLYSKIDNYINETVKEAVQNTLQAQVRERFKEFSEFEMKEILRDRMFESGSYRSQPEHAALYEALEASMDRENIEEFVEATAKSRKRYCDDQDPLPPPLKDSDQNKKKRHDADASALTQP
ncbi:hypothetical protein Tco_0849638 [Tanacetum coccineum]